MTPKRKQRLLLVGIMLGGVAVAVAFGVNAFRQNIMLFHSPSDVVAGAVQPGTAFRVGGMVVEGSVQRSDRDLAVNFNLTDHAQTIPGELHRHPARSVQGGAGHCGTGCHQW